MSACLRREHLGCVQVWCMFLSVHLCCVPPLGLFVLLSLLVPLQCACVCVVCLGFGVIAYAQVHIRHM